MRGGQFGHRRLTLLQLRQQSTAGGIRQRQEDSAQIIHLRTSVITLQRKYKAERPLKLLISLDVIAGTCDPDTLGSVTPPNAASEGEHPRQHRICAWQALRQRLERGLGGLG